jgi:cobalt/nickel transport system permease protein
LHIPDGYLSPQTYVPGYLAMVPIWKTASRKLKASLRTRQVPLLALGAAFSFVVMMFNVPIPGGTTGHAVGSVLIALLLGPWAAVVAVSMALAVQALLFGDGGVTAYGINCLNMAVIMPFVGWRAYHWIAGKASAASPRRSIAASIGGYVGLNAAAFSASVMIGIQPWIAHDASGRALYSPFGLSAAVPAMMLGHLLVFGFVEAAVTGLVVRYLQRTDPSLLVPSSASVDPEAGRKNVGWRLAGGLGALVLLTPLGIYLPQRFAAGSAWGEWSAEEVNRLVGYVPKGLLGLDSLWKAPLPDYALPGSDASSFAAHGIVYLFSGVLGAALLAALAWGVRRLYSGKAS